MSKYIRRFIFSGLVILLINAPIALILALRFFESSHITPSAMYNAGVDVMGVFICGVLFFACLGNERDLAQQSTHYFTMLIVLTSMSFLVNEIEWYIAGLAGYRGLCLILNTLTKWLDVGMTYFFYRYVRTTLDFEGKLAEWSGKVITFALIPAFLILVFNLFRPVCFSIDAQGFLRQEKLYWLVDLYLIIVAPLTSYQLVKSKASRRQKIIAFSFIVIPIIHYILIKGAHGYATQYGSVLVSIILMYSMLFTERGRKLAATQTELTTATRIQNAMLPSIFPPYPDRREFDIYALMDPAREVGGDFYDFFLVDDDHLGLVMADVSGKGIPAALFMTISKAIIHSYAMLGIPVDSILKQTNQTLSSGNNVDMFVTVWMGILEISTGKLTAANAGHEYPAIRRKGGDFELYKDKHGLVLGAISGLEYTSYEIQLEPGDQIFLYTDGVPEATDRNRELFGMDRMLKALNKEKDISPKEILDNVRQAVDD
ncbi:MAG: serine/threonine-protein phosphatase, partial [Erysipelotrichaceae bacterium]|nr:serine/threonine-protein phosphatase [Erysipelotrichaceae bacterium]